MKKVCLLLMSIGMLFSMPAHAQFGDFKKMELMSPHYYPGEVFFVDGHHESYYEVELPKNNEDKISVKVKKEDKKRIELNAIDIVAVKFWHKDFPDNVHVLHYVKVPKKSVYKQHYWGTPIYGNSYGVLYECDSFYEINKKTGKLHVVKFVDRGSETATVYIIKKNDAVEGNVIAFNNGFGKLWYFNKKTIAESFKENASVYEGIQSGKLGPDDLPYIMDEMAGGKATDPATETPAVETQKTTNGEVGDDE